MNTYTCKRCGNSGFKKIMGHTCLFGLYKKPANKYWLADGAPLEDHPARAVVEVVSRSILSERELQVIRYYSQGYNGKQIADILGLSNKTVDVHCYNARLKMNCATYGHLIAECLRKNIIQ